MHTLGDNIKMNLKWDANTLNGFNTQDSFQRPTLLQCAFVIHKEEETSQ